MQSKSLLMGKNGTPGSKEKLFHFYPIFCISTWDKYGTQNERQEDTLAFRNSVTVKIEIIVYLDDSNLFTFHLFRAPILTSQILVSRNKYRKFGRVIII